MKSTVWLPFGFWLTPASGRRWPVPFHVPANEKRVTRSVPLPSKPIDERPASACARTRRRGSRSRSAGRSRLVKSPLIPAVIAVSPRLRWICVTLSRGPVSEPPATTGPIVVSAAGPRRGDDRERDRPARRELHLLLPGDARHQLDRRRLGGHDEEHEHGEGRDETAEKAQHDPLRG